MLRAVRQEYERYDGFIRRVLVQVDEEELNRIPVDGGNSIGMLINHLNGNLQSRFTDFLTSDGEKSWRKREEEFAAVHVTRSQAMDRWNAVFHVVCNALEDLSDADLEKTVSIRGVPMTVAEALQRSVAHVSYHVGQMVLIGRMARLANWDWITIPPGGTAAYNANPNKETGFDKS
ncbi:MAG: DUF1572 family protein [Bacteroidota bacterium]|nr:DUF1572 family protein [Bacteroidota bacterium]